MTSLSKILQKKINLYLWPPCFQINQQSWTYMITYVSPIQIKTELKVYFKRVMEANSLNQSKVTGRFKKLWQAHKKIYHSQVNQFSLRSKASVSCFDFVPFQKINIFDCSFWIKIKLIELFITNVKELNITMQLNKNHWNPTTRSSFNMFSRVSVPSILRKFCLLSLLTYSKTCFSYCWII